jgi:hypothetical protein
MMKIGDRVRDLKYGVTGKVISIHDIRGQGRLAVIRLDKEDPILGIITTAFEREVEIEGQGPDQDINSNPCHFAEKALATRVGTTTRVRR